MNCAIIHTDLRRQICILLKYIFLVLFVLDGKAVGPIGDSTTGVVLIAIIVLIFVAYINTLTLLPMVLESSIFPCDVA
jgi:hypothetical protein